MYVVIILVFQSLIPLPLEVAFGLSVIDLTIRKLEAITDPMNLCIRSF